MQLAGELYYNPNVEGLPKYNAGLTAAAARAASGREFIARLGSNENPHGCSPFVQRALSGGGLEFWRYSDPSCEALREALSAHLGVESERIVVGNGSEEMIAAAARSFLTAGACALTVAPCFGLHEIEPLAVGARVTKVPLTAKLEFDVAGLEAALGRGPNLFYLSSPSNPVGAALDRDGLERLVRAIPDTSMFVLDEAYREFASPRIPDGLDVLRGAGKPYIVLRTFSKAYGLAGLRVGYAVCSSARVARMLSLAKTPFNVNLVAQVAALAALGDQQWMHDTTALVRQERERVRAALLAMGLRVAPSEGNFVFFDTGRSSVEVAGGLLKQGVIVKPWLEPKYQGFIRASIGSVAENDLFLQALAAVLATAAQPAVTAVR